MASVECKLLKVDIRNENLLEKILKFLVRNSYKINKENLYLEILSS